MSFFVNPDGSDVTVFIETKVCSKCSQTLPVNKFTFHSGGNYRRTECHTCSRKLSNERKRLRKQYGAPPVNYVCPVCDRTEEQCKGEGNKKNGAFVLDHCHRTGKFRGWLCHACNRTIGGLERLTEINKAIDYLNNSL